MKLAFHLYLCAARSAVGLAPSIENYFVWVSPRADVQTCRRSEPTEMLVEHLPCVIVTVERVWAAGGVTLAADSDNLQCRYRAPTLRLHKAKLGIFSRSKLATHGIAPDGTRARRGLRALARYGRRLQATATAYL
jgi:hypothetical protein